jgi:hypothetical protein
MGGGHVARINAYKILFLNFEGKTILGKPRPEVAKLS